MQTIDEYTRLVGAVDGDFDMVLDCVVLLSWWRARHQSARARFSTLNGSVD